MGLADERASNNLLIGLGVGLITTVTGLSAAGTFTAINAMNRQSEESIAEAERYQQELDRQKAEQDQASQPGGNGPTGSTSGGDDSHYSEDPSTPPVTTTPSQVDGMTREEFLASLPEQIQWMIEKHITYDEYGLPRDEYGSLMNDPTTTIYDPARWSYFFDEENQSKGPAPSELPTQSEIDAGEPDEEEPWDGNPETPISERPVVAPDKGDYTDDITDPDSMPIKNPAVEQPASGNPGEGGGDNPGSSEDPGVSNPVVEEPPSGGGGDDGDEWWKGEDGEPLEGLEIDEQGKPYYVVKQGDSLGSISGKYGFSVSDVVSASKLTNPNVLYVGDIIRFPDKKPDKPVTPNVEQGGSQHGPGGVTVPDGTPGGNQHGGSSTGLG